MEDKPIVYEDTKKYVDLYVSPKSGIDIWKEFRKPRARCSFCVRDNPNTKCHDDLYLTLFRNREYLICEYHKERF